MNQISPLRKRDRKTRPKKSQISLPESLNEFVDTNLDLTINQHGQIDGGEEILFVTLEFDAEAQPPDGLPSIVTEDGTKIHILVSSDHELPDIFADSTEPVLDVKELGLEPLCFDPDDDKWPSKNRTADILYSINSDVFDLKFERTARSVLETACSSRSSLFAANEPLAPDTPMLIDGFISDGGVAVVYGALDEFKTTAVIDMMMHVALGVPWQGRVVYPRPVIWYALERADEARVRVKALQQRLTNEDPDWGEFAAPFTVLDRIPDNDLEWRAEIKTLWDKFADVFYARECLNDLPIKEFTTDTGKTYKRTRYPNVFDTRPVVVVDTLSQWLGGEDEKGPKAVKCISEALDLLKQRPEVASPENIDDCREWQEENPTLVPKMEYPVASQVVVIHHTTKTSDEFAGHRAIAADTQALYRVKRFGKLTDADRSMVGVITPMRTKDMVKPAALRFEAEVAAIEGTFRTTAVLKKKGVQVPKKLEPVLEALRVYGDQSELSNDEVNNCIDEVANNRTSRGRYRKQLTDLGILDPLECETGSASFYRFNDPN